MAKISMTSSRGDDQIVVTDLRTIRQHDQIIRFIKRGRLTQNDLNILRFVQNAADRLRDLAGR